MSNLESLTNIWGEKGCKRVDGNMCTACCTLKAIDSPWGKKRFLKSPYTNCNFQEIGKGCKISGFQPKSCEVYHCSQESADMQEQLRRIELSNLPVL